MRRNIILGIAIVSLTVAACGTRAPAAGPAPAAATSPGLTPYQRAYAVICDGHTEAPPTDAPTVNHEPLWAQASWRSGFCQGQHGVDIWSLSSAAQDRARYGDRTRAALVSDPPDCYIAVGTPAAPYCPYSAPGR
ncbi:hypothetical protein [Frankia sp. R82]|uniref:hypothetical protein n=1 Tax=Frankia sp. R82 TaxID=2950553 RepID=UPI002042D365|nr:hypothetical protein [Frankia sp. R82]MCM3886145.1 hypothetical protein [Frankia sp. R82]